MQNIAPDSNGFYALSRKSNTNISILFLFFFLFCLSSFSSFQSSITQKLYGMYGRSTHQTNVLLSAIFLFLVRAACELRPISYGPKHVSQWLSCTHHIVRNYTDNSITKDGIRMFQFQTIALLSEISILLVRAVCEIQSAVNESKHGTNHFLRRHFVRPYTRNSKTTGRMLTFYIQNDWSTIGDVYFLCQR